MAKRGARPPEDPPAEDPTVSFTMRFERELLARIRQTARSVGLSTSAFIRLAVIERMQRMAAEQAQKKE